MRIRRTLSAAVAVTVAVVGLAGTAQAAEGTVLAATGTAVDGSYVVVFKDGRTAAARGAVTHTYTSALRGYATRLTEREARELAADPAVAYVRQDEVVTIQGTQPNPPSWGLDRIDQRALPLDRSYTYPTDGTGVTAYVVDTGVRISHSEFGGRARNGYDAVDNDSVAQDGNGHGTHVAGTIGGTTYGVAKKVSIVAVRVLNDSGSGTLAGVVAGIDWVTRDAAGKKAVANLSLGGGANTSIDTAVRNSIRAGVTYGVAAGNSNTNANTFSPARVTEAITVAASTSADARASFSNYGSVIDLFAPGQDITSAWNNSDTGTRTISGTSMAAPHVTGAAALYLSGASGSPQQVRDALVAKATKGAVSNLKGSPNNLLYVR
ncbi:S8 family peptidase [Actinokineospora sp. HUAS TT18]|uniref:S8 family peptidase n=1 Tax=Actinokineospora sp. HUAS TT18 TaxID=3447451 RepID=UPI003F5235CD